MLMHLDEIQRTGLPCNLHGKGRGRMSLSIRAISRTMLCSHLKHGALTRSAYWSCTRSRHVFGFGRRLYTAYADDTYMQLDLHSTSSQYRASKSSGTTFPCATDPHCCPHALCEERLLVDPGCLSGSTTDIGAIRPPAVSKSSQLLA